MTTPVIPVLPVFNSLRAADAHTIRKHKVTATTRSNILVCLVSRKSLFSPKYFL